METKKGLLGWYFNFNLLYRIMIGLILGAVIGMVLGTTIEGEALQGVLSWFSFFGNIFVRLLNMIMLPLIISTLIVGASSVSPAQLGKVGIRIFFFYLATSAFAIGIGLAMGGIFRPQAEIAALTEEIVREATRTSIFDILLNIIPTNIVASIVNVQVLPVIFFSLVFGLALSYLRMSGDARIKNTADMIYSFFEGIAEIVMKMIKGVMQYAPIGVLGLITGVFATSGPRVVGVLGTIVIACFVAYTIHVVLVYAIFLIKMYGKINVRRFIRDAKNPFITAFVTRSSNGTLPVTIQAAENLGVKKDVYSFSLPLGATINMDGAAIYLGVAATFIALTTWGHGFNPSQIGIIILTATLASIGSAGIPGAGAIMLLMVLEAINLPIQSGTVAAGAYAMILGIDALLDMGRTALNVTGDLVVTTVVAKKMKMVDLSKLEN
ncbi:MAG: dicarboxylate/amino acid:cation symporter [Treponema sp.]|nr:dicarboxylate/amino acid:cation symporter [Treponema sp.]